MTEAATQVLEEARAVAEAASRNPIARRYLSANYVRTHFDAQAYSLRVAGPCAVVRDDERFLGVRCFKLVELHVARVLHFEVVSVYVDGVRQEERSEQDVLDELLDAYAAQLEDEELAEAAREMAEEAEAVAALRRELEWSTVPGLRLVAIVPTPQAYCERPGADVAAWKQANAELWGGIRAAELSRDRELRLAGAGAVLGFTVASFRHLRPEQLRAVHRAVANGYFHRDWTPIGSPLSRAA